MSGETKGLPDSGIPETARQHAPSPANQEDRVGGRPDQALPPVVKTSDRRVGRAGAREEDRAQPPEFADLDDSALKRLSVHETAALSASMGGNIADFDSTLSQINSKLQTADEAAELASLTEQLYATLLRREMEVRLLAALQQGTYWVTPRRADYGGVALPKGYRGKTYSGTISRDGQAVDVTVVVDTLGDDIVNDLAHERLLAMKRCHQLEADAFNALPIEERAKRLADSEEARKAMAANRRSARHGATGDQATVDRHRILPYYLRRSVNDTVVVQYRQR